MNGTRLTAEEDMIVPRLRIRHQPRRDPLAPSTRDRGESGRVESKPSSGPPVLSNISSFNNRYDPSNICLIAIPQAGNHNNIIPIRYYIPYHYVWRVRVRIP
jgi:hypothetical protein